MSLKARIINLGKKTALIGVYTIIIKVNKKQRGQFLTKRLLISHESIIPPCSKMVIPLIRVSLPNKQNFLFYPTFQANLILYSHIIDHKTSRILVWNAFDQSFYISYQYKLGYLFYMAYKNYFLIET